MPKRTGKKKVVKKAPKKVSKKVPKKVPKKAPKKTSIKAPKKASTKISKKTSEKTPSIDSNKIFKLSARDFTRKNGKKINISVNPSEPFARLTEKLAENFGIEDKIKIFYDGQLITNSSTLAESIESIQKTGEKVDMIVRRNVPLKIVKSLKTNLVIPDIYSFPHGVILVKDQKPTQVRKRIKEEVIQFVDKALRDPTHASFLIPSGSAENIGYDEELKMVLMGNVLTEKVFRNLSSVQSVAQFTEVMRLIDQVLIERIHATKRDLFYRNPKLFGDQRVSDGLIEDLGAMLRVTRNSLNVIASAKGKVLGRLSFIEGRDRIDCSVGLGGRAITPMIDQVRDFESDAEFVLVIEKDAAFQRLAEDRFFDYIPCILITAGGQPDLATRLFVKKIREELDIPVLGFMDADPYGLDILRVYTIGSKAKSLETFELAVTDIRWLGLLPTDLDKYDISKQARIPMTKEDNRRAEILLKEDFVIARPRWKEEIEWMLKRGEKAEIQALASHELRYMTNVYLPEKIQSGDWI
ncbi:MAG: hypothetical protein ACXAC7_08050 [Candidatus Hodarchaeales archaeon]|jgi:meiotic recombination protein SPO11